MMPYTERIGKCMFIESQFIQKKWWFINTQADQYQKEDTVLKFKPFNQKQYRKMRQQKN